VLEDERWGTSSFRHDVMGRLVDVRTAATRESFAYDTAGSLTPSGVTWAMRAGNVLVKTERWDFDVDECHRRIRRRAQERADSDTEYFWDAWNQLREVRLADGTSVRFSYDAFGRRVRKHIQKSASAGSPELPPRIVEYLWDVDALAAEFDSERGTRVFVHEPCSLAPLLQHDASGVHFYVNDHLGRPQELVDREGRVAWSAAYTAWGAVRMEERAVGVFSPFRLLGQYWDEETQLAHTRFRYFDPETARWLTPDPMDIRGGTNLFAYGTSPFLGADPLGLKPCAAYGWIQFKTSNGKPNGKPLGMKARVTSDMLGTGSGAASRIKPPGWEDLDGQGGRSHLLANRLGGPGDLDANLASLYQSPVNTPIMRDLEATVAAQVTPGNPVDYEVGLNYENNQDLPSSVTMQATGSNGVIIPAGTTIKNTKTATMPTWS
jgi:RHS repeat-associated protein